MRIGQGIDVHPLVEGRPLILGGVEIPYHRGLDGDSDGDVLTHACIDAILGALALGDLGHWFSASDPRIKGASSVTLLMQVMEVIRARGYRLSNLDSTVITQAPRLAPFIPRMRARLALGLGAPPEAVSIKATTTDGLGFLGGGQGVAALAVVVLVQPSWCK